jgi:L-lactate utilization protein LutC
MMDLVYTKVANFAEVASDKEINETVGALKNNGFAVQVFKTKEEAKKAVLDLIPKGSEVFTGTSATLDETGISEALNGGSDYISLRNKMVALMSDPQKKKETKQIAGTPDYVVSSAHALTHDGKIMIASASGSQLPSEAYGANQVIFVVGAQKLVKDLNDGLRRIEEHIVPLEDKRALAAYGIHTSFNKLLVLNKETPGRVTVVIVKEKLGF